MSKESPLTKEQEQIIIELYKSHFTAKEAAALMDIGYNKVSAIYRGFKVARIKRYDRLNLIQNSALLDLLNMA